MLGSQDGLPAMDHSRPCCLAQDQLDVKTETSENYDALTPLEDSLHEQSAGNKNHNDLDFHVDEIADTASLSSFNSKALFNNEFSAIRTFNKVEKNGPVLKGHILKTLSSQLQSACSERVNAGRPTAVAIGADHLVIGTSHGVSLAFDTNQVMKWCFKHNDVDVGAVSCMSINENSTRLLCGHSKGYVALWNLQSGDLIKVVNDNHAPFTAVLHVAFTSDPYVAALSDSGGSVFLMHVNRGRRDLASQCIFSGSRGEVLNMEPMLVSPSYKQKMNDMMKMCILALATVTKVLVVSLMPTVQVHFSFSLKGDPSCVPLLGWQFVTIQVTPDVKVVDPVFAFCRQSVVYFFQATYLAPMKVKFSLLRRMELNFVIESLIWFSSRTIGILDTAEKLHVFDIKSEEELEVVDTTNVKIVYGSCFYQATDTGGNVSKAMEAAGERSCFYSVAVWRGLKSSSYSRLILLGQNSVFLYGVRSWTERIECLLHRNKFSVALFLALSFYKDEAKAVVGLPVDRVRRRKEVAGKMIDMINSYVDKIIGMLMSSPRNDEVLLELCKDVIPACISCLVAIDYEGLIHPLLYEKLSINPIIKSVFLESFVPHIVNGTLPELNPVIVKDLVTFYCGKGKYQDLEQVIVRLEVSCLDIHQIMTICRQRKLYDGIIYIHNQAFDEYVAPLEELFTVIAPKVLMRQQITECDVKVGSKILVYISCCLTGRMYPLGDLHPSKRSKVRQDVLGFLTQFKVTGQNAAEDVTLIAETFYPYLKTLLYFNVKEFLNVLALALDDSDWILLGKEEIQRIVDTVLLIMTESTEFTPIQVGILFTFLARQAAKPSTPINISRKLCDQIIEYLTIPSNDSHTEERQQALLDLVQNEKIDYIEKEKLLLLCESAKYYRVCEYIYWEDRSFEKVLMCYLNDCSRKSHVFAHIEHIMHLPDLDDESKSSYLKCIMGNVHILVKIDVEKLIDFFNENLSNEQLVSVLKKLETTPKEQFTFLNALIARKLARSVDQKNENHDAALNRFTVLNDSTVHELLIERMCTYVPQDVVDLLERSSDYRLDFALEICRSHKVKYAVAFLLEKKWEFKEAFKLYFDDLKAVVETIAEPSMFEEAENKLCIIISFLQRCSSKIVEVEERESLWRELLFLVIATEQTLTDEYKEPWLLATNSLLKSMMNQISLLSIVQWILEQPLPNCDKVKNFSDVRMLLLGMLDAYSYEVTLLETTTNLIQGDLYGQFSNLVKESRKGLSNSLHVCSLCYDAFSCFSEVVVYRCHSFHSSCLDSGDLENGCPKCLRIAGVNILKRRISYCPKASRFSTKFISQKKVRPEPEQLDFQQSMALESLRCSQKSLPAVQVLRNLSSKKRDGRSYI